jgi:hypothetical protein
VSIGVNVFSGDTKNTPKHENDSYTEPYGSLLNTLGLPGVYTVLGPTGKVGMDKGIIQPKVELLLFYNKLSIQSIVRFPFSYAELYNAQNNATGKFLGIEYEIMGSYKINKELALNFLLAQYVTGDEFKYLTSPFFGKYSNFSRDPFWVFGGLTFTPNFFKSKQ